MKISLDDKVTRTVVQEYVNALVNFQSQAELDFDTHKLIHTFKVVEVAQKLIDLTRFPLSQKLRKQILNAAVLHDIGRCHEFQDGKLKKNFNHGYKGFELIKKYFKNLTIEALATKYHNTPPSPQDLIAAQPVLDYTRDADILGNLVYNIEHMPVFLKHIFQQFSKTSTGLILNREIVSAALEKRNCLYSRMEKYDFLDMMLAQLAWIFNLRTEAGFLLAKKERIFPRYRDVIIAQVLPVIPGTDCQRRKTAKQIMELFPDSIFLEEFKRHGL